MKCILFGGSGQVGGCVVQELIRSELCSHVTLLVRREIPIFNDESKISQVVVNTAAADFGDKVRAEAASCDVAISCVGVGSGSYKLTEEEFMHVEVDLVGGFARGCKAAGIETFELLTAVGIEEKKVTSRMKYTRVLSKKLVAVRDVEFGKLAVFKPGVIVGDKNTPRFITFFTAAIPDSMGWGNIRKEEIGQAFVAHLELVAPSQSDKVVSYQNREMKELIKRRKYPAVIHLR